MKKMILIVACILAMSLSVLAQGGVYGQVTAVQNNPNCQASFNRTRMKIQMEDSSGIVAISHLNPFNYYSVCCTMASENPGVFLRAIYNGSDVTIFPSIHVTIFDNVVYQNDIQVCVPV